jgi:hypothetical protein
MTINERIVAAETSPIGGVRLVPLKQPPKDEIEIQSSNGACGVTALTKFAARAGVAWIAE